MPPHRFAILNALCLGRHPLIDAAIVDSFQRGFVTTATLLAYGATAVDAVSLAHAARRHGDSCFAGVVLSDSEKEAAQQHGTFHPLPPPRAYEMAAEEHKDCLSSQHSPSSSHALPLGLMLAADLALSEEPTGHTATTAKQATRKRSAAKASAAAASKAQQPSSATIERRMRQQIEWFICLAGYPPLFVTSQTQIHTSSPYCEILARLLPLYSVSWVTFLEAASPAPPPHGHGSSRRSTLAQSRTARFVYGQHQLLAPQYELEWSDRHAGGWRDEMSECKKGVTEIHVRFDGDSGGAMDAQHAVLQLCDQQQIVLVNHQQASNLSDVHPTLPATLHELSIPSHYFTSIDAAPSAWHTLPSDLIHALHAFLSATSFLLSRRTCRAWQKRALLPGAMWSRLLFHVHPHLPSSTLSRLSETKLPVQKVRVTSKTVSAGSINELRSVARLTHLTQLTLESCTGVADGLKSGGDWMAGIRGLQQLTCDRCDLTDDSLHCFAYLPALVSIDLSECTLSQAAVATLAGCSLPRLTTLRLNERHVNSDRTVGQQYRDEVLALSHVLSATRALPATADGSHDSMVNTDAPAAEIASGARWPSLCVLEMSFSVFVVPHGEQYGEEHDQYVDAVYAFRRARPQITLRTGLCGG